MKGIIIIMGDIMIYLIVLFRSVFFYLIIALFYRVMGKREVGELSIMDFIVSIFIAELAAISIENYKNHLMLSIVPILSLVFLQIVASKLSLKSQGFRNIMDGSPSIIINRGIINFEEMLKQRYNLDDLLTQLRSKSIKSIEEVDYAILETNGKLSVFKKEDDKNRVYPLPVIIDGEVQDDVLLQIGKSKKWIDEVLKEEKKELESIFYGFYRNKKLFLIEYDKIK